MYMIVCSTFHTSPELVSDSMAPPCDCPICYEVISSPDFVRTICNHIFHLSCMRSWGRPTCPMCRGSIRAETRPVKRNLLSEFEIYA